jgi:hypothetical protein
MEYHDHGYPMIWAVSSSSSLSHVVVMGGYAPVSVVIMVIGVVTSVYVEMYMLGPHRSSCT